MANISLTGVWSAAQKLFTPSTNTTNISINELANTTGFNASIPSISQPPMGDNYADSLRGFDAMAVNYASTQGEGHERIMSVDTVNGPSNLCNSFFIPYTTSYNVRSFKSSTKVYRNGTLQTTITNARGVISFSSLTLGDRISSDKPIAVNNSTFPGLQGVYAGYAGFSFATRRDRYTKTFRIFNTSGVDCSYQIMFTSTSNANVTTMTSVSTGTIYAYGYASYSTNSTGNYFILCNQLCVVYQAQIGATSVADSIMCYPLSNENKYGFFSQNGHTFAVNNNQVARDNSGGGDIIRGVATTVYNASILQCGSGRENAYPLDSITTLLRGGAYFSGAATVLYNASNSDSTTPSSIFTAESQADGNGGEMTSFTSVKTHARATVTGGGSAWNAFVSAGFSGSTPTYPLYADVIMRFNSSGTYQSAESFIGQNSVTPNISKAYFGNGAGTGTSANAGDFFLSSCAVQGYQDTDVGDKDESNMIMSNGIDLPSVQSHILGGLTGIEKGWEDETVACEASRFPTFTIYSPSINISSGVVLFKTNSSVFDTPFNGQDYWWRYNTPGTALNYAILVGYNGIVDEMYAC
tara:strand:- start:71 stop:1813 length:1743 start_codon:yes stop_codon:yes gene_type:complete